MEKSNFEEEKNVKIMSMDNYKERKNHSFQLWYCISPLNHRT
jgi:hypothetical protein